jgi:hypothetical protein
MSVPSRSVPCVLAALAITAAFSVPAAAQDLPPANQVVERYVQAVGGRAAFERHAHRTTEAEMSMPAMGLSMTVVVKQARPNRMVSTTEIPGMGTMASGYDGSVAWSMDPMSGVRLITGEELHQTLRQADFEANLDLARLFPEMETVERTTRGDRECWNVRMTDEHGVVVLNCFDVDTGLLLAGVAQQTSPMGTVEVEMVFSEYREFDGIRMPTVTTMSMMGQQMVMTVRSVSHDPIPDSEFELPDQARALVN